METVRARRLARLRSQPKVLPLQPARDWQGQPVGYALVVNGLCAELAMLDRSSRADVARIGDRPAVHVLLLRSVPAALGTYVGYDVQPLEWQVATTWQAAVKVARRLRDQLGNGYSLADERDERQTLRVVITDCPGGLVGFQPDHCPACEWYQPHEHEGVNEL